MDDPPATVDDFTKLINGRYLQGGPGLLFKGPMSGQHSKIKSKWGGLSEYPQRDTADVSLTKKRTDEKSRAKCGKARKTEQVEGKAMAAATSTAGKTLLTVENV